MTESLTRIVEIGPNDDDALRRWHAVEVQVVEADRPYGVAETWLERSQQVQRPDPYRRNMLFAAESDGVFLGVGSVGLSMNDNKHLAEVELFVRPAVRRLGVGATLLEYADVMRQNAGRTTVVCELYLGPDSSKCPGLDFAFSHGFTTVHEEDHLVLDLPASAERLDSLRASVDDDYDVITWGDHCPDEHLDAYLELRTQMDSDVPIGEVDYEPVVYDKDRQRSEEGRLAAAYWAITAAVRRRKDGQMCGYSTLLVPLDTGDTDAFQWDTLVMPEHRGHRLGTALKLATLEILQRDHPDRTQLHTWTDPENHAMHRTNLAFGYVPRERMLEVQRQDPEPAAKPADD